MPKKKGGYANKPKSGKKSVRNYDPKNSSAGGKKGKPNVVGMYSPPKGAQGGNN